MESLASHNAGRRLARKGRPSEPGRRVYALEKGRGTSADSGPDLVSWMFQSSNTGIRPDAATSRGMMHAPDVDIPTF
jgi:hypothetical protein